MSSQDAPKPDSIRSEERQIEDSKKKTKSKRPANTAFRQQRLKAWQPILTPKTVLPLFFIVGIIFAPIGGLLLWASSLVEEISIDYSPCVFDAPDAPAWADVPSDKVSKYFKPSDYGAGTPPQWQKSTVEIKYDGVGLSTPVCSLQFDITNEIGPPVLFYYRLTNFYQNHRRYVKSFDVSQLKGDAVPQGSLASDCDPLRVNPNGTAYYPCGLIANSFFNDTFTTPVLTNAAKSSDPREAYNMTAKGIAWASEADLYGKSAYKNDEVVPPPNWHDRFPNDYTDSNPMPDFHQDEAFQVWMRTAGLPNFSKLAMRNDQAPMKAGRYQVEINDYFPVTTYGGTKSIMISTRTVMGGKNPFLGIAYVVVGGLCILLGALFTATHLIKPRKLGDHTYLTWNSDQQDTATATGRAPRTNEAA
ncbi:CDC50 family protein-like protein [Eremomyces bilateralis CBS 781.70]|uniref:CDC50 family protein-like protein n=1 Tax=Eremomyces bilateralis CBS 781.70 TaxID=1392243 RepID=A0A6G1G990_9PEZI|nr:CDC50 family protein-like protein [Eremomyces bilateralis CBS 781.70]KAF1814470.1 CDC50 family protein-like protein [Eremomyces bilateralis CBS 781.70]